MYGSGNRCPGSALCLPWPRGFQWIIAWLLVVNWSPAKVFMGDVGSTFLVLCSLVWCSSLRWEEVFSYLLLATHSLATRASVFSVVFLLASECFKRTVFICFSACIRPAGLMPEYPLPLSQQQRCWRWPCFWVACYGCSSLPSQSCC